VGLAVGVPGEQRGEPGDADAVDLICQDVVDALVQVRNGRFEPLSEASRDLPQEDA
jgi:hypothetical protein